MPTQITSAGIIFNDATSLTSGNIGTAQLVNGSVITSKLGTNEQKAISKAWVNYSGLLTNGTNPAIPGSYIQSGTTTVTVTTNTAHGLINNQIIYVDIQTGGQSDLTFAVATVVSPTIYTYIATTSQFTNGAVNTLVYIDQTGSFVFDGTIITTTTLTNHNLVNGQLVYLHRLSGTTITPAQYLVTVVSPTVFTVPSVQTGTGGFLIINQPNIKTSYNISSVAYVSTTTVTISFTTPMSSANYCILASTFPESVNYAVGATTTTSFNLNLGTNGAYALGVNVGIFAN